MHSYISGTIYTDILFVLSHQAKNLSDLSSIPKASVSDYSRRGSRHDDTEFLRNENKYLSHDVEKYKAQCLKLNEEIEHLHDRLAEADKTVARISREKEDMARSQSGECQE